MSRRLLTVTAGAALALTAACGGDNTNTANTANTANTRANANAVATATPTATPVGGAYNRNYNTREDFERENANYRAEARNRNESVGQSLEDGWLHVKTRAALAGVDDLRDSTINVDVDNSVVTLRGTVANNQQKAAAAKAAQGVEGVKSVRNQLNVSADGSGGGNNSRGGNNNNSGANTRKG